MTKLTPNIPLLRKTLEHIESHPEEWDQSKWHCGTKFCFAGHACMINGDESPSPTLTGNLHLDHVVTKDGDLVLIMDRAREILGLSFTHATFLFTSRNSLPILQRIVDLIITGILPTDPDEATKLIHSEFYNHGLVPLAILGLPGRDDRQSSGT